MNLSIAILAGGRGTRLGRLAEGIPKALVPVAGKPFLFHQIELLRLHQIQHIVLCVGHRGEMVQQMVGDGSAFHVRVDYAFDGPRPLGTAGALKNALRLLGDAFFVLYGDSYLNIDYQAVSAAFERSGKLGLMTVFRNQGRWDRSNVLFREGKILSYNKRAPSPEMRHIDYGLGLLSKEALSEVPAGQCADLADLYENLLARGELAGFEVQERFYEIGSPEGLRETAQYLSDRAEGN